METHFMVSMSSISCIWMHFINEFLFATATSDGLFNAKLTPEASDMYHVANNLLTDVLGRLVPGQL